MISINKLLYYLKQFLGLTSVMFSVTILVYSLFHQSFGDHSIFITGVFEALGLAIIFSLLQFGLSALSNHWSILSTTAFVFIQYVILLIVIISWSIFFEWGEWSNPTYALTFVGVFTVIYLVIFFLLNLKLKKEEVLLNKQLKQYQDKLH